MQPSTSLQPLTSQSGRSLKGAAKVPGDKSISHRALMLGALALGRTRIQGLLEGEDVLRTAAALRHMGVESGRDANGQWWVEGEGAASLREPQDVLDLGNSGTSTRLLMGLVGSHNFTSFFTGDESLRKRPMGRVIEPLSQMGVNFLARDGGKLPITVMGTRDTVPITYRSPVASAQVKSAILLCGLNTQGVTTVIEPQATRDHSEIMLRHFGADVMCEKGANGEISISLRGYPELKAQEVIVPGDPSSAAFVAAAALLKEGSELLIQNVGINPLRAGFYETVREMGADLTLENQRLQAGEKVADVKVKASSLKGIRVPASRAPSMIDEYPILGVLAAFASGKTVMEGLGELRVKESDRLSMIASNLQACGAKVEIEGDNLIVHGTGKAPKGGAKIATAMDHRIAMSFLVMGSASAEPISIDDGSFINTSFPGFVDLMNGLGMRIA
ncbi:MAG TPA: 3-phosphoshikimate 1-carboxyvinyltransferase [Alphaproteobacteria bacterium]|nr:3-phosphoshikimate 1-carboxyvinyltransferase [Alphaproteobacteria bacterium]